MNKTLKNFLMISLTLVVFILFSYILTSCSVVFSKENYTMETYKNSYFQSRKATILFRFTKAGRVFVFNKDSSYLSYNMKEKEEKTFVVYDDKDNVHYELYAIDEDTLYVYDGNYYLYRVQL